MVPYISSPSSLHAQVHIVMALAAEARPIITALKLSKLTHITEYTVFADKLKHVHLIVSGVGRVNAAAATAFLHALTGRPKQSCYLNIGIAGSGLYALGECVLAHKLIDHCDGKTWYPTIPQRPVKTGCLLTVAKPLLDYSNHDLLDMEAAGFFHTACRCVSQEQIRILKVVSDTQAQPHHHITAALVTDLMQQQLPILLEHIQDCQALATTENKLQPKLEEEQAFLQRWHFTTYQQHQLRELLRRWSLILTETSALSAAQPLRSAEQVLKFLTVQLDQANYRW